ncbi:MAG: ABC transporter permease, partial [Pseudobdellovibrionaceae bacterium]
VESHYGLLPGSIYKIERIDLSLRWTDALAISVATLLICFLATLAPALRGASLSPVEGLKNE